MFRVSILRVTTALVATLPVIAQPSAKEQALAREMRRQFVAVDDPAVVEYAQRIAARLAPEVTVDVVSDDGSQPVPLPGNIVLIPAKLFSAAQDEAEFAAALAHAFAHVQLRHGFRTSGAIPWGYAGACGMTTLVPAGFVAEARAQELAADRLAMEMAARTGYPPAALRSYVERRQTTDLPYAPVPPRAERLAAIDAVLATLPPVSWSPSAEYERVAQQVTPPVTRKVPSLRR